MQRQRNLLAHVLSYIEIEKQLLLSWSLSVTDRDGSYPQTPLAKARSARNFTSQRYHSPDQCKYASGVIGLSDSRTE